MWKFYKGFTDSDMIRIMTMFYLVNILLNTATQKVNNCVCVYFCIWSTNVLNFATLLGITSLILFSFNTY